MKKNKQMHFDSYQNVEDDTMHSMALCLNVVSDDRIPGLGGMRAYFHFASPPFNEIQTD